MKTPTIPDLISRSVEDHAFLSDFVAHAKDRAFGMKIAELALQGAIDDWCDDSQMPDTAVGNEMRWCAIIQLIDMGWTAMDAVVYEVDAVQDRADYRNDMRRDAEMVL